MGRDHVWRAIDLVDFHPELRPAMEHILGGAFVCSSVDVAKELIFRHGVGHLAVTLDGDKINKSGELSGGAPPSGGSLLTGVAAVKEARQGLDEARRRLSEVDSVLREAGPKARRHKQLANQFAMRVSGEGAAGFFWTTTRNFLNFLEQRA